MRFEKASVMHALVIGAVAATAAVGGFAARQPERAHPIIEFDQLDQEKMMAEWVKRSAVGGPHKWLERFVGDWDLTIKIYSTPGMPAMESKGKASCSMVLGGRYLKEESSFSFLGQSVSSMGLTGFDNARKLFNSMQLDTLNTHMHVARGSLDGEGKVLTLFGQMDEFMTGEVGKTYMLVTRIESDDRHVLEVQEVLYGDPFTVVEIVYDRAEAGEEQE